MFSTIIKRTNVDFKTLDKCLYAVFKALAFKKLSRIDHLVFYIDSENTLLEIKDNNSEKYINLIVFFGRKAIVAGLQTLHVLINIAKSKPEQFNILYKFIENNEIHGFFAYLKTIEFTPSLSNSEETVEDDDTYDINDREDHYFQTGHFCPACQEDPCMCSHPYWLD